MKRIRLVVVDDHALFRAGLTSLLADMNEFEIVGEASNGMEALDIIHDSQPDIVLLDVNMPGLSGVEVVEKIRESNDCKILMLTISKHEEDLFGAINAGADGYLIKNVDPEDLRKAILQIFEGKSVLSPDVTRPVLKAVTGISNLTTEHDLSSREIEVLNCLAKGMTTIEIASELFISDNTVKTHIRHILEKLDASNRAEAVSKGTQFGLIDVKYIE
jgi:DNA-binding NarL/FixJ family response regulator